MSATKLPAPMRGQKIRLVVEVRGPKTEKQYQTFAVAFLKLLRKHKVKLTQKKVEGRRPKPAKPKR